MFLPPSLRKLSPGQPRSTHALAEVFLSVTVNPRLAVLGWYRGSEACSSDTRHCTTPPPLLVFDDFGAELDDDRVADARDVEADRLVDCDTTGVEVEAEDGWGAVAVAVITVVVPGIAVDVDATGWLTVTVEADAATAAGGELDEVQADNTIMAARNPALVAVVGSHTRLASRVWLRVGAVTRRA